MTANGIDSAAAFRQRRAELKESGDEGREFGDVTTLRDPDVMSQLEGKVKEEQKKEE